MKGIQQGAKDVTFGNTPAAQHMHTMREIDAQSQKLVHKELKRKETCEEDFTSLLLTVLCTWMLSTAVMLVSVFFVL